MRIEVGAKIRKTPFAFCDIRDDSVVNAKDMEGTIIHVNREHRHFTVEYEFPKGKFRETFKMNPSKRVGMYKGSVFK